MSDQSRASAFIHDLKWIPLKHLEHGEYNVRDGGELNEGLQESIKTKGVVQTLLVIPQGSDKGELYRDNFLVIAGGQRLDALRQIYSGDTLVPCAVTDKIEPMEQLAASAIENKFRTDLTPTQWKDAIYKFEKLGLNQTEIARAMGVSKATISMMKNGRSWKEYKEDAKKVAEEKGIKPLKTETFPCPACGSTIEHKYVEGEGYLYLLKTLAKDLSTLMHKIEVKSDAPLLKKIERTADKKKKEKKVSEK